MDLDSDVVLLGTGVAPLAAANFLITQGKSVLVLNPDWDFFLENSELPMDPLLPFRRKNFPIKRIEKSWPEHVLAELRPDFPGAVEYWSGSAIAQGEEEQGYQDVEAPYVRNRGRLWVAAGSETTQEDLESLYVQCSDHGFNPQVLEGVQVTKKFPGCNSGEKDLFGLFLPKVCDVDLSRYRNGLLEYIRERLGAQRVVSGATQIEFIPEGIRFYANGQPKTARIKEKMLVFWTPKTTSWILSQAKKLETRPVQPQGVRLWEEWSLASRHSLDPSVVGIYRDMAVWTEVEGSPERDPSELHRLVVLRAGALASVADGFEWASGASFEDLTDLCLKFLKWEHFKISSFRPRAILEWVDEDLWTLSQAGPLVQVVCESDGPLFKVVKKARNACEHTGS